MEKFGLNRLISVLAAAVVVSLFAGPVRAGEVDHSLWADLLAKHVSAQGLVDYSGLEQDRAQLEKYLDLLAGVDHANLEAKERFAFLANAYNAWTAWFILTKWPDIESIKDLGSFFFSPWKKKIVRLKGGPYSLDNLEHGILRPDYQDPRVHFALNCASLGCPPLYARPFTGRELEGQLNEITRAFINDPARTFVRDGRLHVSKIFDWYAEDFGDLKAFVQSFANPALKAEITAETEISYLEYDWSLNRQEG